MKDSFGISVPQQAKIIVASRVVLVDPCMLGERSVLSHQAHFTVSYL